MNKSKKTHFTNHRLYYVNKESIEMEMSYSLCHVLFCLSMENENRQKQVTYRAAASSSSSQTSDRPTTTTTKMRPARIYGFCLILHFIHLKYA